MRCPTYQENLELSSALGTAIVNRGVLQHFFVGPVLPMGSLAALEVRDSWARLAAEIKAGRAPELLSLYVHIPFCEHLCRYCVYYRVKSHDRGRVQAYLKRLHAEIDLFAEALDGTGVSTCYVGGGTPTVLDPEDIDELLTHIDGAFTRKRGGEWSFECNPLSGIAEKADVFAAHGFNRVSFGVQTLNQGVLEDMNRGYQSMEHIAKTFEVMKKHRFWINVDLIHGLPGIPRDATRGSLDRLMQLRPTQVTIYNISPYTPMKLDPELFRPMTDILPEIEPVAKAHGYRMDVSPTCVGMTTSEGNALMDEWKLGDRRHTNYDDTTVEPFSLLGLGPTARSYVYGQLRYSNAEIAPETPFDPSDSYATGRVVTLDEERRRYIVAKLGKPEGLEKGTYSELFGESVEEHFPAEVALALAEEVLEEADGVLRQTRTDMVERFATELFFVDETTRDVSRLRAEGEGIGTTEAFDVRFVLEAWGVRVVVVVFERDSEQHAIEVAGDYGFFVERVEQGVSCQLGERQELLLDYFGRVLHRVVERDAPASLPDLRQALMATLSRSKTVTATAAQ